MAEKQKVYISLGSNAPNKEVEMVRALAWLDGVLSEMRYVTPYLTQAVGNEERGTGPSRPDGSPAPPYLNCVARGLTDLTPAELQSLLKDYEADCGRDLRSDCGTVLIDLDLVIYASSLLRPLDYAQSYFQQGFTILK